AVAVVVGALGAAVLILDAVLVLGDVGALVELVGDAVAIVVGLGAAIPRLEAVEVLRVVGALVDVVLDAIAVAVADVGLEDDADHRAEAGVGALVGDQAATDAERQERVAREVQLDATEDFERHVVVVRAERDRAVDLADDVELLARQRVGDADAERDLGAGGDRGVGDRGVLHAGIVVGERLAAADANAGVERDPQRAGAAELLVEDAHHLRHELAAGGGHGAAGRLAEKAIGRAGGRQVQTADHAEPDVRRAAGLEEAGLEVEADVADALTVELELVLADVRAAVAA